MRLTRFSDYSLRVLMYAATQGERLITIEEVAKTYRISRTHLMKVCNQLTKAGFLRATRGRSGGLTLARPPSEIGIGAVLRWVGLRRAAGETKPEPQPGVPFRWSKASSWMLNLGWAGTLVGMGMVWTGVVGG